MALPRNGIVPYLFYEDAGAMMDWYARVFGFVELSRWPDADGNVVNGEMSVGQTELWLDGGGAAYWEKNGRGPAPWIGVWVDDLDALCAHIRSEGVEVGDPVERNFGVRMSGEVVDPAGYKWGFMERVSLPDPSQSG
jgi:PhnB protein